MEEEELAQWKDELKTYNIATMSLIKCPKITKSMEQAIIDMDDIRHELKVNIKRHEEILETLNNAKGKY